MNVRQLLHLGQILGVLLFPLMIYGQGVHSSQTENIPLHLNPAQTGILPSDYRIGVNYRLQNTFDNNEFKTFHVWGDIPFTLPFLENGFFGIGFLFSDDNTASSILNTKTFSSNLSYQHNLNENSILGIGINANYVNNSFNKKNLIFEDQWTGLIYDVNLISKDNFSSSTNFLALGAGLNFTQKSSETNVLHVGFAFNYINQPVQSFLLSTSKINTLNIKNVVPIRYNIYANYQYELNENFIGKTLGYLSWQGSAFTSVLGTQLKYQLPDEVSSIGFGLGYRFNSAIILTGQYEFNGIQFSMSYDTNLSTTNNFNYISNALEFSIIANLNVYRYQSGNSQLNNRIKCKF